jgi:hypothetical protein
MICSDDIRLEARWVAQCQKCGIKEEYEAKYSLNSISDLLSEKGWRSYPNLLCSSCLPISREESKKVCHHTGLSKSVKIEYYIGNDKLGESYVSEASTSTSRKEEAKNIGIEYYDRFVLGNGRFDSRNLILDGKIYSDFIDNE